MEFVGQQIGVCKIGHVTFAPQKHLCKCGRKLVVHVIVAEAGDRACDPRCTGAIGHICVCACGGENHGVDNLIAA